MGSVPATCMPLRLNYSFFFPRHLRFKTNDMTNWAFVRSGGANSSEKVAKSETNAWALSAAAVSITLALFDVCGYFYIHAPS
jgi:hypothetical protein